jgi:hypothetical protein
MTIQLRPDRISNDQFRVFFSKKHTALASSVGLFSVSIVSALGVMSIESTANKVALSSLSLLTGAFSLGCYSIHLIDLSIKKLTEDRHLLLADFKL